LCGGKEAIASLKDLYGEFEKVMEANKKDEAVDKDGKADVDSLDPKELVIHKTKLVLQTVDPTKVSKQMSLLYTGWIGVLATLKIKFAKTVTLGLPLVRSFTAPRSTTCSPL